MGFHSRERALVRTGTPRLVRKVLTRLRVSASEALSLKAVNIDGVRISVDLRHVSPSMRKNLLHRSYEGAEREFLRKVLRRQDRVLDLGASTGLTALLAARIVGPSNVLAYEANPRLEPMIRHNFGLNGLWPGLEMRAVTSDGRNVAVHVAEEAVASSILPLGGESIEVPSDAFRGIVEEFRPTVVSMDIEGAEAEVVGGDDFPGVRAMVVETHPAIIGMEASRRVENSLCRAGFRRIDGRRNTSLLVRESRP